MNRQSQTFWWRWLMAVTIGTVLFGLSMIFLPDLVQDGFNLLLFSEVDAGGRFDAFTADYIQFVYGVLGAVMVGWGILIGLIVVGPFRRGEREAWNQLAISLSVWFVVDSAYSLYSGYPGNAALNTVFFILFAVPLAATYRQFHRLV